MASIHLKCVVMIIQDKPAKHSRKREFHVDEESWILAPHLFWHHVEHFNVVIDELRGVNFRCAVNELRGVNFRHTIINNILKTSHNVVTKLIHLRIENVTRLVVERRIIFCIINGSDNFLYVKSLEL